VRRTWQAAFLLTSLGCDPARDPIRPSYDPCTAGVTCGLDTRCAVVPWRLAPIDAAVSLCTADCNEDRDCPGFDARCLPPPASDAGAQCYRGCVTSLDCRNGTTCHALRRGAERLTVCVPDNGRFRCARDQDCAPFDEICGSRDAGTTARDASGLCQSPDGG
jgi:hypothetical protein